jgi:hypothetical protein
MPLLQSLERRGLIRGSLSRGALVMLTGCDVKRPEAIESALLAISRLNDSMQELLFDPNRLAPTYPASMILDAAGSAAVTADLDGHQAFLRRGLELYRRLDWSHAVLIP